MPQHVAADVESNIEGPVKVWGEAKHARIPLFGFFQVWSAVDDGSESEQMRVGGCLLHTEK